MDYEKKYKEALERASIVHKDEDKHLKATLEQIFPELKESEDERIRKALLEYFGEQCDMSDWNGVYGYQVYAWLEKQGEQKPADKVEPKFKVGDWVIDKQDIVHQIANVIENVTYHTYSYDIVGGGYFNDNTEGVRLWSIQDAKNGDVLAGHESFVIFKEIEGLNIKCYCTYHYMGFYPSFYVDTLQNKTSFSPATKEQRNLLFQKMKEVGYEWDAEKKELRDIKQKPDGKVKPKFHKGEWIISDTANKDYSICKIIDVKDGNYTIESIYGYKGYNQFNEFDNTYRLWTIQDAKDGDVLFKDLMSGMTFIFDGVNPEMAILYSFIINNDGREVAYYNIGRPNTGIGYVEENKNIIHPATKEQRDLLFQKMKEAGYEWDAEKKELKKIEEINLTDFESALFTAFSDAWQQYLQGESVDIVQWAKEQSKELLEAVKEELKGHTPVWSEEDEEMLTSILDDIMPFGECPDYPTQEEKEYYYEGNRKVQWLKSLKERLKGE